MRAFRLRRSLEFSELVFLVVVLSAIAAEWSDPQWWMLPKITSRTVTQTIRPDSRPVMTISGAEFLKSELTNLVFQTQKFRLLERSLLGETLEELHDGAPGAGIGAKYLLECRSTPLFKQKHTVIKAKIVLTETGRVVTEKEVAGELNAFADLDSLITKLIQALMTDPKFIASLSPAEKNSWGIGRLKVV